MIVIFGNGWISSLTVQVFFGRPALQRICRDQIIFFISSISLAMNLEPEMIPEHEIRGAIAEMLQAEAAEGMTPEVLDMMWRAVGFSLDHHPALQDECLDVEVNQLNPCSIFSKPPLKDSRRVLIIFFFMSETLMVWNTRHLNY